MSKSSELFYRDKESVSDVMKLRFYPFVATTGKGLILKDPDDRNIWTSVRAGEWQIRDIIIRP